MDTITIVIENVRICTLYKFQLTFKCLKADLKSQFFPLKVNGKIYNNNYDYIIQNMYELDKIVVQNTNKNEISVFFKNCKEETIPVNEEFIDFITKLTR